MSLTLGETIPSARSLISVCDSNVLEGTSRQSFTSSYLCRLQLVLHILQLRGQGLCSDSLHSQLKYVMSHARFGF